MAVMPCSWKDYHGPERKYWQPTKSPAVTVSGSIPSAGHLFQYVTNQPPKANSAFHPSWIGKWVPASAGKAKAGMVHSVSGWTRGVQVKLWDPLRTRAILSALEVRSRRDAIQIHVYLTLPYLQADCLETGVFFGPDARIDYLYLFRWCKQLLLPANVLLWSYLAMFGDSSESW